VGQGWVKDVAVDRVKDVAAGMVKDVDGEREVQTDDFPRGRDYNEYTGKNNNNKAMVKNLSEYWESGTCRDCNNRVTWTHIHTD
jgi:hypothetical protein